MAVRPGYVSRAPNRRHAGEDFISSRKSAGLARSASYPSSLCSPHQGCLGEFRLAPVSVGDYIESATNHVSTTGLPRCGMAVLQANPLWESGGFPNRCMIHLVAFWGKNSSSRLSRRFAKTQPARSHTANDSFAGSTPSVDEISASRGTKIRASCRTAALALLNEMGVAAKMKMVAELLRRYRQLDRDQKKNDYRRPLAWSRVAEAKQDQIAHITMCMVSPVGSWFVLEVPSCPAHPLAHLGGAIHVAQG